VAQRHHRLGTLEHEAIPLPGKDFERMTMELSSECLAFVQVRRPVLVTRDGVWNPELNVEGLKYRSGDDGGS
jgi:hypothetical protein